jgi:hypothetical protein
MFRRSFISLHCTLIWLSDSAKASLLLLQELMKYCPAHTYAPGWCLGAIILQASTAAAQGVSLHHMQLESERNCCRALGRCSEHAELGLLLATLFPYCRPSPFVAHNNFGGGFGEHRSAMFRRCF